MCRPCEWRYRTFISRRYLQAATAADGDFSWVKQKRGEACAAVVECDVVIVGAGAGGGVAAWVLRKSGLSVLVVEKGNYVHPREIAASDADALKQSFECAGLVATEDTGVRLPSCTTYGPLSHVKRLISGRQ
jgi:hypothetical protein